MTTNNYSDNAFRAWLTDVGLSQSECSRIFGIPLRTVQDWMSGRRQMPDYTFRMLHDRLDPKAALLWFAKWTVTAAANDLSPEGINAECVLRAERLGWITVNTDARGHDVVWYLDCDSLEAAFDLEDVRLLTPDEIAANLE